MIGTLKGKGLINVWSTSPFHFSSFLQITRRRAISHLSFTSPDLPYHSRAIPFLSSLPLILQAKDNHIHQWSLSLPSGGSQWCYYCALDQPILFPCQHFQVIKWRQQRTVNIRNQLDMKLLKQTPMLIRGMMIREDCKREKFSLMELFDRETLRIWHQSIKANQSRQMDTIVAVTRLTIAEAWRSQEKIKSKDRRKVWSDSSLRHSADHD